MTASGPTAGLSLLSAACWGGSDIAGGLGARRAPALQVATSGQNVSLFLLAGLCVAIRPPMPGTHPLFFAAVGGFEGAVALAVFYRALAMGAMGLTAALTGLLTALVPVLFSLIHDGLPKPLACAGLALGLAAIWLITHSPVPSKARQKTEKDSNSTTTPPAALWLGALAGLGFGTQLILFKFAAGGSLLWVMTSARAAGVAAMLLVILFLPPARPWRGFWLFGIAAGALDTFGNLLYMQTTRLGRLDTAAVVSSLYPAGTILLAALVLREWPSNRQFAGIAVALTAVALLSM